MAMIKASQLISQILSEINVREVEAPLEADEVQDTLFNVNAYMSAQSANGIDLGFTILQDLGDNVTVPYGALQGIIANVALNMCPTFGVQPSAALALKAKVGLDAMYKLGMTIAPSAFPDTLPIGSGNYSSRDYDSPFYPDPDAVLETEQGGSIALEKN